MELFLTIVAVLTLLTIVRYSVLAYRTVAAGKKMSPFSQEPNNTKSRILIVGDSTAYGTGASTPKNSLIGRLAADFPAATIINKAENSRNFSHIRRTLEQIKSEQFDIVMVHAGGIDTITLRPLASIEKDLRAIIIQAKRLGARYTYFISVNNVGVAPFFTLPVKNFFTSRSRQISVLCESVSQSESNVIHIPLFREKDDDPLFKKSKAYFSSDKIHPNDAGYAIWYHMIASKLDKLKALYDGHH